MIEPADKNYLNLTDREIEVLKHLAYGYLQEIRRVDNGNLIWKAEEINALMQVEQSLSGDNIRTYQTYDSNGIPTGVQSGSIFNWQYTFNTSSGNLTSRKSNIFNLTESFSYDALNRLTSISKNGVITSTLQYANSGNISYKSDAGNFNYAENGAGINALTSIDNPNPAISTTQQDIDFTSFSKVSSISEGDYELLFKYDPEQKRRKTELLQNNNVELTKIFATNYEKNISGSNTKELHYIWGGDGLAAVYVIDNGQGNMYYVYKDHLGSILALTNESGSIVSRNSFDAWGRPRNPTDWSFSNVPVSILDRGFTGHEHLEEFNLINMNGRVYDPIIGRFLSVDPYVQDPGNTQGLNRYSYCLNNPLIYTDPDGEFIFTILASIIPGAQFLLPIAIGMDMGALSGGANASLNGESFWKGAAIGAVTGGISGATSYIGIPGIIPGGLLQSGASVGVNGITNLLDGDKFFNNWVVAAISGFASGAYSGYKLSDAGG